MVGEGGTGGTVVVGPAVAAVVTPPWAGAGEGEAGGAEGARGTCWGGKVDDT